MSHLTDITDDQCNELLSAIVDVDNLYISMLREQDQAAKVVYRFLFHLLRDCILFRKKAVIQGPLGDPPFERPTIGNALTGFLFHKYGHLGQGDFHAMTEVAKTFLQYLNNWIIESPRERCLTLNNEDASNYKINYTRWLVFCHVPAYCSSLKHFNTTDAFGRTLLKAVYQV